MELAVAFRNGLPPEVGAAQPDAALEARLAALVARGRAAHPDLTLDELTFVRHLATCVAHGGRETAPPLEQLHIEDVYLACACAAGVAGAAARFEERCGARLKAVLAAVKSPDLRAEIRQRVLDVLLVGTAERPPKISAYSGHGPVDSWTAVVAQRQLTTLLRRDASEQRAREGAALEAALHAAAPPETALAKQRYLPELKRSMADALLVLDERDRLLLRLQLVSQVSVTEIGNMYGVAQATASRWLASARDRVQTEVIRLLRERLGASPDEVASLVRLVASEFDLSLSRLLSPADVQR